MIDFQLFSGAFLTPLCPGDGFAAILVREVATLASKHYSIILRELNTHIMKRFYEVHLGFFPILAHMMRRTPAPIKENSMRKG